MTFCFFIYQYIIVTFCVLMNLWAASTAAFFSLLYILISSFKL